MYCLSVSVSIVGTNVCYNDNSFHFVFSCAKDEKTEERNKRHYPCCYTRAYSNTTTVKLSPICMCLTVTITEGSI